MAGNLNVTWIHGSPNCATTADPPIQVHQYDSDTFILRQSKCSEPGTTDNRGPSFEAPFLYLLIGRGKAFLLDTGASQSPTVFPLASTVERLLHDYSAKLGIPAVPLVIAHSHSHGDHIAGDAQFFGLPNTTVVAPDLFSVKAFFGLTQWPMGSATLDLGDRILDILPIPGHEESHIAVYDRNTNLLLTGDSLYPGLLVVNDWTAYVTSIARLSRFVDTHPLSFVLGAHIEMKDRPGRWFELGTLFQPGEHKLQLETSHLRELNGALQTIGAHARTDVHADFVIWPWNQPLPASPP